MGPVVVIGHDGLDYNLCHKMEMENMRDGEYYPYKSGYMETVRSWTSIYLGTNRHPFTGGWDNWLNHNYSDEPDLPYVWNDINNRGYSIGVYGMPLTYPPFELNGWVVSGFPCPGGKVPVYPSDLGLYINRHMTDIFDTVTSDGSFPRTVSRRHWYIYVEKGGSRLILEFLLNKMKNLKTIWNLMPVDVVFVGFSFVDHALHLGHKNIQSLYKIADMSIGDVKSVLSPSKLLIVSDHGFEGESHTPNAVLYVEGAHLDLGEQTRYEKDIKRDILSLLE